MDAGWSISKTMMSCLCFGQGTVGFIFPFLRLFCHEHTLDHSVFIPTCMQDHIWLFECVCFLVLSVADTTVFI